MALILDILVFLGSLALLVKGADYFVESSSKIARRLGVSELVIGLTLVSLGTSLPELGTAISASMASNSNIILGNIVGSNIANIALVLGFAMALHRVHINWNDTLQKSSILMLGATVAFLIFSLFGVIDRIAGVMLLLLFAGVLYFLKEHKKFLKEEALIAGAASAKSESMKLPAAVFVASLATIFIGAKYLIPSASSIALSLGISEVVIGLFAIAIGTSLPELAVSISSVRKKKFDIFIGNIVGSNIANLLLVGGVSAAISPLLIDPLSLAFTIPFMLILSVFLLLSLKMRWKATRLQGYAFLGIYTLFIAASFLLQNVV